MSGCPRCRRPIALERASCLYCGAPLARQTRADPVATTALEGHPRGVLLGFWTLGAEAGLLADALKVSAYEAGLRLARSGPQLWRVLDEGLAAAEEVRLRSLGLKTWTLAERRVRAQSQPRVVLGGCLTPGSVRLRVGGGAQRVEPADLAIVVRGPVARQPLVGAATDRRGVRANAAPSLTLPQGYRFHLHLRDEQPPLELDPADFEFEDAQQGQAPYLALHRLVGELGTKCPTDDTFRSLTPALAPSQPQAGRAGEWLQAGRADGRPEPRLLLDNLAQFRFFSAWRGLLERERAPALAGGGASA